MANIKSRVSKLELQRPTFDAAKVAAALQRAAALPRGTGDQAIRWQRVCELLELAAARRVAALM